MEISERQNPTAMELGKNTVIFNLLNPNLNLPAGSPNKHSRICFTALPKRSRVVKCKSAGRNAAERNNDSNEDWRWSAEEGTKEKAKENRQKGKTREGVSRETEKGKERATEGAHKVTQTSESGKEMTGEGTQQTEELLRNVKENTKQKAVRVKEKTDSATETVAETAKEGAGKVSDTVQKMGEKAKKAVTGVWGTAKETSHKIKETVLGPEEQVDGGGGDHEDEDGVVVDSPKREDVNDAKNKLVEDMGQKKRSGKSDEKN